MSCEAVFIKDIFNIAYEVVGPATLRASSYAASMEKCFHDEQSASQFICRNLNTPTSFWARVCGTEATRDPIRPGRVPHKALAKMMVAGRLRFYQVPNIQSHRIRLNGKGKGYGFLRGPQALPNGLQCLGFNDGTAIQSLLNSLGADEAYWHEVLSDAGLASHKKEAKDYQSQAFQCLQDGSLRAYTFPYTSQTRRSKSVLEDAVVKTVPLAPPSPEEKSHVAASTLPTNPPQSLDDAEKLLAARREQIKTTGYQQKYTDAQLLEKAQTGEVNDRFFVRLIFGSPEKAEAGTLGYRRDSGRAPYWATTLDMAEAADSDPELLSGLFGITDYDPNQEFSLAVIDMDEMPAQAERQSFIPTYENMRQFGEKEFMDKEGFDSEVMKSIMDDELAAEYSSFVTSFEDEGGDLRNPRKVKSYAKATIANDRKRELIEARYAIQSEFGANPLFSGLGLTKVIPESRYAKEIGQQYGVVETFNFERDPLTIGHLQRRGAVKVLPTKMIKS